MGIVGGLVPRVPPWPSRGIDTLARVRLAAATDALVGVLHIPQRVEHVPRQSRHTASDDGEPEVHAELLRCAAEALWRLGCNNDATELLEQLPIGFRAISGDEDDDLSEALVR